MELLPQQANGSVRQRKQNVGSIVQEFDAFNKVVDDVKEEPKAVNGFLSVICFSLIIVLLVGLLYEYFTSTEVEYKFAVDTDFSENLFFELDLQVATPCNNLALMPMGVDREAVGSKENSNEHLKKNPSRFEMNSEEEKLWTMLKKVHKQHFKPGTPLKALYEMTYIKDDVEEGLRIAADEKQKIELKQLEIQRKEAKEKEETGDHDEGSFFLMIGNGLGVFQIISGGGGGKEIDEGSACRINGKVPVIKGNGDRLTISVGKSMNIGNIMAHIGGSNNHGNISHRIERFHFGPHVWGLVSPLAGHEQISDKATEYRYYIKVVPTKIYKAGLFSRPTMAYQYAVTYSKKEAKDGEHIHDSIVFDYEFTSIVIEVRPRVISFMQLMLRICSLIGGVFATSSFLEAFASKINIFSRFSKVQPVA